MKIYLAGPMSKEATRGAVAPWRKSILDQYGDMATFLCPELMGCDHTGIDAEWTVDADIELIRESDAVLAWVDCCERIGTSAEIGYAKAFGKPIAVIVEQWVHDRPREKTDHICHCRMEAEGYGWPWFIEAMATFFVVVKHDDWNDSDSDWEKSIRRLVSLCSARPS